MTEPDDIAWMNGDIIAWRDAVLPVADMGVVAGASISEMARTCHHQPFRLKQHVDRLVDSCGDLGFSLPFSKNELVAAAEHLVRHNASRLNDGSDLGIVLFVTAGSNPTYSAGAEDLGPTICIHTFELPFSLWRKSVDDGAQLAVSRRRQLPEHSFPVHRKTRNRLHWWLADREANELRPGARALLLDENDHITETSSACFFALIDGAVVTPKRGVLRSLSREVVRESCDRVGIRFRADDIPSSQMESFQEVFLSSTPCGLLPVASIDDYVYPGSAPETVLSLLQKEWTRITGVDTFQQIRSRSSA